MSHFTYVDNVDSNLDVSRLKPASRMPFIKPMSTMTCSHTFCSECITTAISTSAQCPVDRSPLTEADLQPANPIVRNLVDELIVECTNRENGCFHTGQRQLLPVHLRDKCEFVQVPCSEKECPGRIFRKDVQEHFSTCEHRIKIDLHETTCPDMIITCDHASNGCSWTGLRRAGPDHLNQCPYETIKDFLSLNASRISFLEVENSALRNRVDELETTLRSVRHDMELTKLVLGPWYRQDGPLDFVRPSPPTESAPPRRPSNAIGSAVFGFSNESRLIPPESPASFNVSLQTFELDPLAQFFPSSNVIDTSPAHVLDGAYRHPLSSSIAPLNLNTSLEGSLTSLRNSIITLASSLDSEVRRHDVALSTESLRVNEEVMALRAVVHGLRMQVHQIMMDRNSQVTGRLDEEGVSPTGYVYSQLRNSLGEWQPSSRYMNHALSPTQRSMNIGPSQLQTTKL
ncbi:hypothetical protein Clacol_000512 [Clathrus columnatus]|uniref:Uncharacterized protein n=1 Tax=Clathrus columnatus TaxID=1419009 RepID=A0AAV5A154_9AGAM|nr:hypothetical protein Clacol_000512 [Clathrus columnatus]